MPSLNNASVVILGLGLIGGSIARALKAQATNICLVGYDSNQQTLKSAISDKIIDKTGDLQECVMSADVLVLALPPRLIAELIPELPGLVSGHTVITDVASVKYSIKRSLKSTPHDFQTRFVLGHPIAGSEKSGYAAGNKRLFNNRNVILTPDSAVLASSVATVNELWRLTGANVLGLELERHDRILALTSHLPHLLAYAMVDTLAEQSKSDDIFRYAAGGFADFSRLSSSDPEMWSEIFLANASEIEQILNVYIERLELFKEFIKNESRQELAYRFNSAKVARDYFMQNHYTENETVQHPMELINYLIEPGGEIKGAIRVPGDKSISHRAIIFGAIADGVSEVTGFLEGEDTLKTLAAFQEMGVTIIGPHDGRIVIYGVGVDGLKAPRIPLYMGNSGTAIRLLAGVLAGQKFDSQLLGDESLNQRPMKRISEPLSKLGANIKLTSGGNPPINICGNKLTGVRYDMKIASAQIKSCLLLAGIYAEDTTSITEPAPCRDHTERMLNGFGYPVTRDEAKGEITILGGGRLTAANVEIPADISSASSFMVAAAISRIGEIKLNHVGINPTRTGILSLLSLMGANIKIENKREIGGEPVGDITVRSSVLNAINVPAELIAVSIDEFPIFCVAAACAEGTTLLRGAEELRVKESDRIEAMAAGLRKLGIKVQTFADGLQIEGGTLKGGEVDSYSDHRVAMAFVVAALRASEPVLVKNCENVATSFPGFVKVARSAGINVTENIDSTY